MTNVAIEVAKSTCMWNSGATVRFLLLIKN